MNLSGPFKKSHYTFGVACCDCTFAGARLRMQLDVSTQHIDSASLRDGGYVLCLLALPPAVQLDREDGQHYDPHEDIVNRRRERLEISPRNGSTTTDHPSHAVRSHRGPLVRLVGDGVRVAGPVVALRDEPLARDVDHPVYDVQVEAAARGDRRRVDYHVTDLYRVVWDSVRDDEVAYVYGGRHAPVG